MEAAAEYYAGSLSLRAGYVDFQSFQRYLGYGERDPWRDAILAQPTTWASGANYLKGSLVWGAWTGRFDSTRTALPPLTTCCGG